MMAIADEARLEMVCKTVSVVDRKGGHTKVENNCKTGKCLYSPACAIIGLALTTGIYVTLLPSD